MNDIESRIKAIEDEIRETPYHKGTEHHIGKLKARAARLREEQIEKVFKSHGGGGKGYAVKKTGDATVVLVGPPSVGKSTLLNRLTRAESKVAAYDFTTVNVIPGMLDYKGAKIQIMDVPGIIAGASAGKGHGKEVLAVARNADLVIIMVDNKTIKHLPQIFHELNEAGIRIIEKPPQVTIVKQLSGGIKVSSTTALKLSYETIKSLASEFRLPNAEIVIKEDISLDRLIDAFMANRAYLPFLLVINKADLGLPKNLNQFLPPGTLPIIISAEKDNNFDCLKERIWTGLALERIYLKEGDFIDKVSPLIVKQGKDLNWILANLAIPKKESFTAAKVFGPGAKYPGQEVSFNFIPLDETVVQFIS